MVGGGPGAFIGQVHRKAALIDGQIEIVAGAFSSSFSKSRETGRKLYLSPNRIYEDYKQMIQCEVSLPEDERIDFVSIVTPNYLHFPISRDFLKAGFNVVCDKPLCMTLQEAKELKCLINKSGKKFCLTHNYTGSPMVKLARDMIKAGDIGNIRKVVIKYSQGWLSSDIESSGQKQALWRTDPKKAGAAGCLGDVGIHATNLLEYITGLKIVSVCADITAFVPNRKLDDDCNCLIRLNDGAKGILCASQISTGDENGLSIWVYGDRKSIEWHQEQPESLNLKSNKKAAEIWKRGNAYIGKKSKAATRATRIPPGHPEGYLESFANIYKNFADTLIAVITGKKPTTLELDFPDINDGIAEMAFIEAVIRNSKNSRKWTSLRR